MGESLKRLCDRCQTVQDELDRRGRLSHAERTYEDEHGADALARQREEAEARFVCCGELRDDGHHEECSEWTPPVNPDQIGLEL